MPVDHSKWWDLVALVLLVLFYRILFFIVLKLKERASPLFQTLYNKRALHHLDKRPSFRKIPSAFPSKRHQPLHSLSSQEGLNSPLQYQKHQLRFELQATDFNGAILTIMSLFCSYCSRINKCSRQVKSLCGIYIQILFGIPFYSDKKCQHTWDRDTGQLVLLFLILPTCIYCVSVIIISKTHSMKTYIYGFTMSSFVYLQKLGCAWGS